MSALKVRPKRQKKLRELVTTWQPFEISAWRVGNKLFKTRWAAFLHIAKKDLLYRVASELRNDEEFIDCMRRLYPVFNASDYQNSDWARAIHDRAHQLLDSYLQNHPEGLRY